MALNINDANIGVSANGSHMLGINLNYKIRDIISKLNGQEYQYLVQIINNNWSGASKEAFMRDLTKKKDQITKELTKLSTIVIEDIDKSRKEFEKADSNIYISK